MPIPFTLLAVLAGIAVAVVQASFFEWTFHRFWLHRPGQPGGRLASHTLVHHQLRKIEDTFHVEDEAQREAPSFVWWGGPTLVLINVLPWALLAWGIVALGVSLPVAAFVIAFGATMALYYLGYEGLHFLMRRPALGVVERGRYFQFIKRHHRIHHLRMDRNLNVLLPLADLVIGTLVVEEPAPAPTPDTARRLARRHSRFGKGIQGGAR